jgi:beta-glucuronidase
MLHPRSNAFRQIQDLSGIWSIRFDGEDAGKVRGWQSGFEGGRPIAVPASWNDQFAEGRDFLGPAWYTTEFEVHESARGRRLVVRFGSVNYIAEAWLNGEFLGVHEGGHLPFQFDVTGRLSEGANRLVVRVDGRLAPDRVPPGGVSAPAPDSFGTLIHPSAMFDFFPFCGIQRPVSMLSLPVGGIDDVTVVTRLEGKGAKVCVRAACAGDADGIRMILRGFGPDRAAEVRLSVGECEAEIAVPKPALWAPGAPNLYNLTLEATRGVETVDRYTLPIGIREVAVTTDAILLNGRPVYLKGFGRHEDFPVAGRGFLDSVAVKDCALMEWVGANSFRTTHYPYGETTMDLADRLGFLVIDETPAVGLFFLEEGLSRRLELCKSFTRELIARDKNHPSVIAWSLANEPHSKRAGSREFFRELFAEARALDPTRPATMASYIGAGEPAYEFSDFVCLNRYSGWYSFSGQIDEGCAELSRELDEIRRLHNKPMVLTEFGADTVPGCHAVEPEMFSEEYQARFIESTIAVLRSKPFVVGEHVWNLCDFKTGQEVKRFGGMNLKGVFTRDRRPKMAAHALRRLWTDVEGAARE